MHSSDMRGSSEHFGARNLLPNGVGSYNPRSHMHLHTCWLEFLQEI